MSLPITVRRLRPDDVEALLDQIDDVAAEGRWIAMESPIDRVRLRGRILDSLDDPEWCQLVAETEGQLVGNLAVRPVRAGIGMIGMGIADTHRRRGVGSALLAAAVEWARAEGLHKLQLEVFPHNEGAIALYRAFGFEDEGLLRRHQRRRDGALWDVLLMALQLS